MTKEKANKIYDVLVTEAGANESERENFIFHHCDSKYPCDEWRFQGKLGFGGKYWRLNNRVTCYSEDETTETLKIIEIVNNLLNNVSN